MFTFSDEGVALGAHVHQTKKMWLQGLHPKFVIALNKQPRKTTEWMREQYRRQADQLQEPATDPTGKLPPGAATAFRSGSQSIEFCVDLDSQDNIEWPLLGKRSEDFENPAKPDWPAKNRVFYALNPHLKDTLPHMQETLEEVEKKRVGEQSFPPASSAEKHKALERQRERVMNSVKVSSLQRAPVEAAEVLRPAAEVFGVVAKEHGYYYGEAKQATDPATGQRRFVPPEDRRPDPGMPPNAKRAANSVLRMAPLAALYMTNEQKAASGVPETAVRFAYVYPNPNIVLQVDYGCPGCPSLSPRRP